MHARAREFVAAFEWLSWGLDRRPHDLQLRSRVGYLQLAVGDIAAAGSTFQVSFVPVCLLYDAQLSLASVIQMLCHASSMVMSS